MDLMAMVISGGPSQPLSPQLHNLFIFFSKYIQTVKTNLKLGIIMKNELFYIELMQEEMYDLGNLSHITHYIVYDQENRIAVDITSDVDQAPLLSAVNRMEILDVKSHDHLDKLIEEGLEEPSEEEVMTGEAMHGIVNFYYEKLEGQQYKKLGITMLGLRAFDIHRRQTMDRFYEELLSTEVIKPKEEKDSSESVEVEEASFDPKALDEETKRKLTDILEKEVSNLYVKNCFYRTIGDKKAEEKEKANAEKVLQKRIEEYESGRVHASTEVLFHEYTKAKDAGLNNEIVNKLAEITYENAKPRSSREFDTKLYLAKFLGKPQEDRDNVTYEKLGHIMANEPHFSRESDSNKEFLQRMEKASEDIPEKKIKEIAETAYKHLIKQKNAESFTMQAVRIAKAYLDEKALRKAAIKLIEIVDSDEQSLNAYEFSGRKISLLNLPDDIVRPYMLRVLERTLSFKVDQAKEIIERHEMTNKEIAPLVNSAYRDTITGGAFAKAKEILENYGELVCDRIIPEKDFELLVKVMEHREPGELYF